jgi:outer membrane protein OmpA-like peptidoglycan-associated protein
MRKSWLALLVLPWLVAPLSADCGRAGPLVDQAFALEVRSRVPLLESAAKECPSFQILESLGESYQARGEWDAAQRTYILANTHVVLQPDTEREHQQALLLYRSAQISMGRGERCRAVAQFGDAVRRFTGSEQQQARAEMLKAEAEWTDKGLSASDIRCSLSTQIVAHKAYCEGGRCRLYHDAAVDIPVQFATDSAALSTSAVQQVNEIASGAATFVAQGYSLRITGHTDKRGTREYNYALSRERARTVARSLAASLHLPEDQIEIEGKGFDAPKYEGDTSEINRLNRRVEVALRPATSGTNSGSQ